MTNKTIDKTLLQQEQNEIDHFVRILLHTIAERNATRQRVTDLISKLQIRVMAHLKDDEPDGFLRKKTRKCAELIAECEQLCQCHANLTDHFERVGRLAKCGTIQSEWWNDLDLQFRELSVEIGQYLSREQELLDKIDDDPL